MKEKLSIRDLSLEGKKVLVRVDFNCPLDKNANIADDNRIAASLSTIQHLLDHGAAVILMSHLGRPKGTKVPSLTLRPCAERLGRLLNHAVKMAPDCIGPDVRKVADGLRPGEILMLENLRFHPAEEKPDTDPTFAQQLAALGDLYINDAFGAAHRAHSSVVAVSKLFPGKAAAGFLMEKEINYLNRVLTHPSRPFVAIVGGAKVSSKLGVIQNLVAKADSIILGGGMAYTFLAAQNKGIGNSLFESDLVPKAQEILEECRKKKVKLLLPLDSRCAKNPDDPAPPVLVSTDQGIPEGLQGLDIGPETIHAIESEVAQAGLVLWNGPLGVFESPRFAEGTFQVAKAIARADAISVVGGGDSTAAVRASGLEAQFSHISTGGGATLEFLEYGQLPGITALSNRQESVTPLS